MFIFFPTKPYSWDLFICPLTQLYEGEKESQPGPLSPYRAREHRARTVTQEHRDGVWWGGGGSAQTHTVRKPWCAEELFPGK